MALQLGDRDEHSARVRHDWTKCQGEPLPLSMWQDGESREHGMLVRMVPIGWERNSMKSRCVCVEEISLESDVEQLGADTSERRRWLWSLQCE